jgi:exodeoxyribonuclease V alpha subunit
MMPEPPAEYIEDKSELEFEDEISPLAFDLDKDQLEAVNMCTNVDKRLVGVTGSAGTGKTSIMKAVFVALTNAGYDVVLCAPTGKAAKRIKEATGIGAMTIHRLLEYTHPGEPDPKTGKPVRISYPKRDRINPLEVDFVLADEYAMVNQEIHRNLFDALPSGGCVRVFGDINQLPPIESNRHAKDLPSPFEDILTNDKIPSIRLETIHRQTEGSGIVSNGALINKGFIPTRHDDFALVITDSPVNALKELVYDARDHGPDFSSLVHQIITPTNKTWIGTVALNPMLQDIFHPDTDKWWYIPRHKWDAAKRKNIRMTVGDKVINTNNNYELQIFNGESGIIKAIEGDGEYADIVIDFGDREVVIPPELEVVNRAGREVLIDPRKDIDLAYALTTHKSQGSEYGHVIYLLNKTSKFVQSRKNFYTGVTRARVHATVISDQTSLGYSVWKKYQGAKRS